MATQPDNDGWQNLVQLIGSLENRQEREAVLQLLFTFDERSDLAKRILIIKGLLKGKKTQRSLAKELNVSIAKITRGSNALKTIDEKLEKLLLENLK